METEPMKIGTAELEEGEISDSTDGYTPLPRPSLTVGSPPSNFTVAQSAPKEPDPSSSDDDNYLSSDSTDSDAAAGVTSKAKKRKEKRAKPMKPARPQARVRPEKYNIWAQTLQDDLLDTMKGCEVRTNTRDRAVESYDYRAKYRLNGETVPSVKRRQSYSDDSDNYNKAEPKRFKSRGEQRISAKLRLGARISDDNSSDGISSVARHILDLTVTKDSTDEEVAQDLANKLSEEKDDLLLQAIRVVGRDVPMRVFVETQKIEKDGGMMTINGQRRRTPGGVFLYLLKNSPELTENDRRKIFVDERKAEVKKRKIEIKKKRDEKDIRRERKVEELKKSLSLSTSVESDLRDLTNLLKPDNHNPSLSNPPPSPVTDGNRESSPDFDSTKIMNKLSDTSTTEKPEGSKLPDPNPYEDDFLDMTCDDMDLF